MGRGSKKTENYNYNFLDLKGQKFNKLTVVSEAGIDKYKYVLWNCECECGNKVIVRGHALKTNKVKSCGCLVMEKEDGEKYIGQKFGKLTVESIYYNSHKQLKLVCRCDCGEVYDAYATAIKKGTATSCRHCRIYSDLTGKKFGRWTVLGPSHRDPGIQSYDWYWKCKCDCGYEKLVKGQNLKRGKSVSCGCFRRDYMKEHMPKRMTNYFAKKREDKTNEKD